MSDMMKELYSIGLIPVIKIENADDAVPLANRVKIPLVSSYLPIPLVSTVLKKLARLELERRELTVW